MAIGETVQGWRHLKPNTQRVYISHLRRTLQLLQAPWECYAGIPNMAKDAPRNVTVPEAEIEAVIEAAEPWLKFAILCSYDAALRTGTVVRLTAADIASGNIRMRTKRGRHTNTPMTVRLAVLARRAALMAKPGQTLVEALGLVIKRRKCAHITDAAAVSAMSYRKRLQQLRLYLFPLSSWHPHDLRRTAARRLYARTGDLRAVQALLSHAGLGQSLWYLQDAMYELSPSALEPHPTPQTLPSGRESRIQ